MGERTRKLNSVIAAIALVTVVLTYSGGFATVNGVHHRVRRGETVWRISRAYSVPIDTIKKANSLSASMRIKAGQYLLIPGAARVIKVEPEDYQIRHILNWGTSNRWEYIVIHHSATHKGNARVFDKHHRNVRGFHSLGYHFVIDNGTYGRRDGQIEVGTRWRKQQDGAHCRADDGNKVGIGICLVGNFNETKPTEKQFDSLVHLITHLCYLYNTPIANVRGHGEMAGANTECPGKNFPWEDFKEALRERGCK